MRIQKMIHRKYMMTCSILFAAGLLLTGCEGKSSQENTTGSTVENTDATQNTETTTVDSSSEENGDDQGLDTEGAVRETDAETASQPEPLTVLFANRWLDQWSKDESKYLLNTAYNEATLDEDEAEKYPALQSALETWSKKETKRMKKLHKETGGEALEISNEGGYSWENSWTIQETANVSRADTRVVSLRLDYKDYIGGAHGMYYSSGVNFDVETGKELRLSDVFVDVDGLQDLIEKRLIKKYKRKSFYSQNGSIWADYGKKQSDGTWKLSEGDYTWWMTLEGVTFYFAPYTLAPYAGGDFNCTIAYSEKDYIQEKYAQIPEQYIRELSFNDADGKVRIDLDGDGQIDTLKIQAKQGEYDEYESLTIKVNNEKFKKEAYAFQFVPLLVHMRDGRNYLYVQYNIENDYRQLYIFDLSGGSVKEVGHIDTGYYIKTTKDDYYTSLPANPNSFKLTTRLDALSTYDGWKQYHVGEDGMPEAEEEYYQVENNFTLTSKKDLELSMIDEETGEEAEKELIPKGSKYHFYRTDGKSYVDMKLKDGRVCRLHIKIGGINGQMVEGKKLDKCFKGVMFAG